MAVLLPVFSMEIKWNINFMMNLFSLSLHWYIEAIKDARYSYKCPFLWHELTLFNPSKGKQLQLTQCVGRKYLSIPKLQRYTVDVWQWINDYTAHFTGYVITYHVVVVGFIHANTWQGSNIHDIVAPLMTAIASFAISGLLCTKNIKMWNVTQAVIVGTNIRVPYHHCKSSQLIRAS